MCFANGSSCTRRAILLGVHVADLPTREVTARAVAFTFFWTDAGRWEGQDFCVAVEGGAVPHDSSSGKGR